MLYCPLSLFVYTLYHVQWLRNEGADWPNVLQYDGVLWTNDMICMV
jgi:hypothetical protein